MIKANATTLRNLYDMIKGQWVVPVYQRRYAWSTDKDKQLSNLWADLKDQVESTKNGKKMPSHYFGAVITLLDPNSSSIVPDTILVDGQQRITTFTLMLIALREVARKWGTESQVSAIEDYLYNNKSDRMDEPKKEKYKLWPSYFDRKDFQKIFDNEYQKLPRFFNEFFDDNGKIIQKKAPPLLSAYDFLYNKLLQYVEDNSSEENAQEETIGKVFNTFLDCFQIVLIRLGKDADPQQIFASLNGLAEPLSPADLIKNDIFHRAEKKGVKAESLYERKWRDEFDNPNQFWTNEIIQGRRKKPAIDHFIEHVVVAETAKITDIKRIVSEYRHHVQEKGYQSVEHEIDALLEYAETYKALAGDIKENNSLFRLKSVFDAWDISKFYPLVMAIKKREEIDSEAEKKLFHLIESYIVRRTLCGLTQQNYNNVVSAFVGIIKDEPDPVKKFLERLFDSKADIARFPLFDEVLDKCKITAIYPKYSKQIPYILFKLNEEEEKKYKNMEKISIQEKLSIEHIMPQTWDKHWCLPSGEQATNSMYLHEEISLSPEGKDEFDRRIRLINTIGNLTLVTKKLNPSLSNGPWNEKREKMRQSILALNIELVKLSVWNEGEIIKRSEDFAKLVEKIWPADVELY